MNVRREVMDMEVPPKDIGVFRNSISEFPESSKNLP
jgi:hypothetical protein